MTTSTLALSRAQNLLAARVLALAEQLDAEPSLWTDFVGAASALASISAQIAPGHHGELLTTAQLAERVGVSAKTILKRRKAGEIREAIQLGKRGRAALRWRADARFDPGRVTPS